MSNHLYPAIFVNHGGGPLPLLGRQPGVAQSMKEAVTKHLSQYAKPDAIVVLSAHYESNPVEITSSMKPSMYYDYSGFPAESYTYKYPAPGSPDLAKRIQNLLGDNGIKSKLNKKRGFDHGVFVPLMLMYPEANIPVVCVSMHSSLDAKINMKIGHSLAPLRNENILILGSGYTFHNMRAFFYPSRETSQASVDFNEWLRDTMLSSTNTASRLEKLEQWKKAPGAKLCHPREEHLIPLFMVAATAANGDTDNIELIYDTTPTGKDFEKSSDHAVTGYKFT